MGFWQELPQAVLILKGVTMGNSPASRRDTGAVIEDGVLAGNLYDKYGTKNPVARYLMQGFRKALFSLVKTTGASHLHEVGCGEGNLSIELARQGKDVRATDFSQQIIAQAVDNARANSVPVQFNAASIYDLVPERDSAELIVCCEVLEHLEKPEEALAILDSLANPYLIVSVPREPLWSILNMARGKYLARFGNTPGHCQRWSKKAFMRLLASCVEIVEVKTPVPWTMVLCRSKRAAHRRAG